MAVAVFMLTSAGRVAIRWQRCGIVLVYGVKSWARSSFNPRLWLVEDHLLGPSSL